MRLGFCNALLVASTTAGMVLAHGDVAPQPVNTDPKFSSWSKTELWQVVDVEPMPVFGKFYNG